MHEVRTVKKMEVSDRIDRIQSNPEYLVNPVYPVNPVNPVNPV